MNEPIAKPVAALSLPFPIADLPAVVSELEAEHGPELTVQQIGSQLIVFTQGKQCGCGACTALIDEHTDSWLPLSSGRMIVCEDCGNKRCPHAWSHDYVCGQSNDPGQQPVLIEKE